MPGVLYLHGFCSSSRSAKGTFLFSRFADAGIDTVLPDLDGGDFQRTTLSSQLRLVGRIVSESSPDLLIGSSLGGYLAALFSARRPDAVPAVALLAPAFDFASRLHTRLGEETRQWREEGSRRFYHYGAGREVPLDWGFVEDALQYEAFPNVTIPAKVIHGLEDSVADPKLSIEFARNRPNVELEWLASDHQMLDVTEGLWSSIKRFYDRIR